MSDKAVKVINYKSENGYGDDWYTLSINGTVHKIHAEIGQLGPAIAGPDHMKYLEIDESQNQEKIVWSNYCINVPVHPSQGYRLDISASVLGEMIITAKIIEGKEVSKVGSYIPTFVNDKEEVEAIVYPYLDLDWEILQNDYIAYHSQSLFEKRVVPELYKYGFSQNEEGRWVLVNG